MGFDPTLLLVYGIPLLLAIPLHETAHGYAAYRFGDDTAYRKGRLTLNPIKHIDPIGTIAFPTLLIFSGAPFVFGWAKPVPVNFAGLRDPRWNSVWVAAAGPAVNLVLAFISALGLRVAESYFMGIEVAELPWWVMMLQVSLLLNVALAIFNMIPLLPLDGGRVLHGVLPPPIAKHYAKTERYGFFIILFVLIALPLLGNVFGADWNLFTRLILPPILLVADFLLALAGVS